MSPDNFRIILCMLVLGLSALSSSANLPDKNLEPFEYEHQQWMGEMHATIRENEIQRPIKRMETRVQKLEELQCPPDALAQSAPIMWETKHSTRRNGSVPSSAAIEKSTRKPFSKIIGACLLTGALFFVVRRHLWAGKTGSA